jgi:hypothetical protein
MMLRLMTEMMKLPVTLFVSGMEVLVRAMRECQQLANQVLDATVENFDSDAAPSPGGGEDASPPPYDGTQCVGETEATGPHDPQDKESDAMVDDKALGSEDLKTVRYRIIFTKRNHETTLKEAEATVNYATDPMSLSGRYISDFWAAAALGQERGALKRLYAADYHEALRPGVAPPQKITKAEVEDEATYPKLPWTIPDDDKRYIAFRVELLDQLPRQKAEYDREKVDVLREIRDAIKDLPDKM